jgi:hypothetical protein
MPRTRLLAHVLHAISLDPLSYAEIGECDLPAGTSVEVGVVASEGDASSKQRVKIRVVEPGGWVSLKLVTAGDLERALGKPS